VIQVVSKRKGGYRPSSRNALEVYIGRGTSLGNPYEMENQSQEERDRVCGEYESWLKVRLADKESEQYKELWRLFHIAKKKDLHLLCWCAPLRCHGDFVKKILERMLS